MFNQFGDVERRVRRPGDARGPGWRAVLEPVVARRRGGVKRLYFRGDAAFGNPETRECLEAEGIGHAIGPPTNRVARERIG